MCVGPKKYTDKQAHQHIPRYAPRYHIMTRLSVNHINTRMRVFKYSMHLMMKSSVVLHCIGHPMRVF